MENSCDVSATFVKRSLGEISLSFVFNSPLKVSVNWALTFLFLTINVRVLIASKIIIFQVQGNDHADSFKRIWHPLKQPKTDYFWAGKISL